MCVPRSPAYKAPREVDIIMELPKTSTGKIQKFILRDKERAGQASAGKASRR